MTNNDGNFLVPTANRSFVSLDALSGIGLKTLNTIDDTTIWSTILRIDKGATLPSRNHTGLCEMLVIEGRGHYESGDVFGGGDYLREDIGDYGVITAEETILLFITHHGVCTFSLADKTLDYVLGREQIKDFIISG